MTKPGWGQILISRTKALFQKSTPLDTGILNQGGEGTVRLHRNFLVLKKNVENVQFVCKVSNSLKFMYWQCLVTNAAYKYNFVKFRNVQINGPHCGGGQTF